MKELSDAQNQEISLVTGGEFTVEEKENKMFDVNGRLELQDGTELEFSYSGSARRRQSFLGRPAGRRAGTSSERAGRGCDGYAFAYRGIPDFSGLRSSSEYPDFDYVYIQLYSDNNYMNCIDLGLIVDKTKSDGETLHGREVSDDEPLSERICFAEQSISRRICHQDRYESDDPLTVARSLTNDATENPPVDGEVEVLAFECRKRMRLILRLS